MIHRSEKKPSGPLTVAIAIAGCFALLASGDAVASTIALKSAICILAVLMMNRIGVTSTLMLVATMLFAVLIVLENPLIPFQFSEKSWMRIRLGGVALFILSAVSSLIKTASDAKKSRVALETRNARVGFR